MDVVQPGAGRLRMPDLLIRGMSSEDITRLKAQASENGRSMQTEAKSIMESGIRPSMQDWLRRVGRSRDRIEGKRGRLAGSSVEIVSEMRELRKQCDDAGSS